MWSYKLLSFTSQFIFYTASAERAMHIYIWLKALLISTPLLISIIDTNIQIQKTRPLALRQEEGRHALRDGKSLFLPKHVKETKYHGISYNIAYCFVKAKVMLIH